MLESINKVYGNQLEIYERYYQYEQKRPDSNNSN